MSSVPLNIDFQQILIHLLNVVILFAIMYFLIYAPVKKFMQKRKSEYEAMDKEAEDKLSEADQLKKGYEAKLQSVEAEIIAMKAAASDAVETQNHELMLKAEAEAQKLVEDARLNAENEKKRILNKAGRELGDIAKEAASKAVFASSSEAIDAFLKAAKDV